jgi:hypothetical protein
VGNNISKIPDEHFFGPNTCELDVQRKKKKTPIGGVARTGMVVRDS